MTQRSQTMFKRINKVGSWKKILLDFSANNEFQCLQGVAGWDYPPTLKTKKQK